MRFAFDSFLKSFKLGRKRKIPLFSGLGIFAIPTALKLSCLSV
nr:MAG TPA: hypothetical protein [Inoviridae sp.]